MFKLQGAYNSRSLLEIPFQGKRLQMSSFEHPNLQEMLQLQGASPLTPFAMIYFQIFVGDPLSW